MVDPQIEPSEATKIIQTRRETPQLGGEHIVSGAVLVGQGIVGGVFATARRGLFHAYERLTPLDDRGRWVGKIDGILEVP